MVAHGTELKQGEDFTIIVWFWRIASVGLVGRGGKGKTYVAFHMKKHRSL